MIPAARPRQSTSTAQSCSTAPREIPEEPPIYSVLVVDDHAENRAVLSGALRQAGGYRIFEAVDGLEALRTLQAEPVDLVILDIMMPTMDGRETLKRLRRSFTSEELPVLMATAMTQTKDMVEAFDLGADDYITKPFQPEVAIARVQALLREKPAPRTSPRPLTSLASLSDIKQGTMLDERYRLEEMIGSGSNGAVYRAVHEQLQREVAVKLLHTTLRDDEEALALFQKEGASACRIEHPNAVAVLDFAATRYGIAYLVMELLRGRSLSAEIKARGRLPLWRAAEILCPVCDVLADAHSMGMIHRDVKPQNIFLHESRRGEIVKVLDFGLAKLLEDTAQEEEDEPTFEGIAGTLGYISPERISAEPYDGRSDVYSLGVVLYELLAGERPFVGVDNPLQLMMMHVRKTPPSLRQIVPEIEPEVEELVFSALAKNPRKRPTAEELRDELMALTGLERKRDSLSDQTGYNLNRKQIESALSDELASWREHQRSRRQSKGG